MVLSNSSINNAASECLYSRSSVFVRRMIKIILEHNVSKKEIQQETGISISTLRRILLDSSIELSYLRLKKLLYLYCWVITKNKCQ